MLLLFWLRCLLSFRGELLRAVTMMAPSRRGMRMVKPGIATCQNTLEVRIGWSTVGRVPYGTCGGPCRSDCFVGGWAAGRSRSWSLLFSTLLRFLGEPHQFVLMPALARTR